MIAFLHTSPIHIEKFEKLVRQIDPNIPIEHFVNEELLSAALKTGKVDEATFSKQVDEIKTIDKANIICTCSTLGSACDSYDGIERIDAPIATFLVSKFTTIGVAYTAKSTLTSSVDLLELAAKNQGKNIEIFPVNCTSAWKHYESGDFELYAKEIATTIKSFENTIDVVFLAQASMEETKEYLQNFEQGIFSSPEFGVREFLRKLNK